MACQMKILDGVLDEVLDDGVLHALLDESLTWWSSAFLSRRSSYVLLDGALHVEILHASIRHVDGVTHDDDEAKK